MARPLAALAAPIALAVVLAVPGRAGAAAPDGAPMTAANRTSGVAPLAVFFDAVDTEPEGPASPFPWKSGVVQPADREGAEYAWDFGDPGSGTWATTGLTRNAATGYTAAHVYERPGRYPVTLAVADATGAVHRYRQTITVSEFTGTTYYVAASGDDRNPGTSAARAFASFDRGLAAVSGGPSRRLLLRRGDTFTTAGVRITTPGPGIVGAYGEGPRPILKVSGKEGGILVSARDWRVMDLDIVGPGAAKDEGAAVGYQNVIQTVNALVLRVRATEFRVGLGNGDWKPIYATPHDGNAWVDCEVTTDDSGGMYVGGRRLAVMGNDLHDMTRTHVLRVWQAHKGVVSNNRLWNPGPTRHALKLHGPAAGDGRPETRWVTVSDNLIRGKTWAATIGPQDGDNDERVSHVVFERNRTFGEPSLQIDLLVGARDVLVRNNVFDGTGDSKYYVGVSVARRGVEPPPRDVRILANTIVRTDASQEFTAIRVDRAAERVTFRNNLVVAPLAPSGTLVDGQPGAGFVQDHNLLTASPGFVRGAAAAAGGAEQFELGPGSPAVDAGAALGAVRSDYRRGGRPRGAAPDLGAFESR